MHSGKRKWTVEEDDVLRAEFGKTKTSELAVKLCRTVMAIGSRSNHLGIRVQFQWTPEDDAFVTINYGRIDTYEIAKYLNRSHQSVNSRAFLLGVKCDSYWSKEEDDLLRSLYLSGESQSCISKKLNRTIGSIHSRTRFLGIRHIRLSHMFNRSYFHRVTDESAYWAGFIAADGNITPNISLNIKLAILDYDHLEKFRKCVKYDSPVKIQRVPVVTMIDKKFVTLGEMRNVGFLSLCSQEIVRDLDEIYNITPKKSLTLVPPRLECIRHRLSFIVGLIDGDGCIYIKKPLNLLCIQCGGTLSMMEWVKSTISSIVSSGRSHISQSGPIYTYTISGKRAVEFSNIVSSFCIPKLERKWSIAEEYVKKCIIAASI
jgi:hypothetical protein